MEKPKPLNELGILLKAKIDRKHQQKINYRNKELWGKCLECEGAIDALENVWIDLMFRNLLNE